MKMRKVLVLVAVIAVSLFLCACPRHIIPDKFELNPDAMRTFAGGGPIRIVVPENAEKQYRIVHQGGGFGEDIILNLNDMYVNTRDQLAKALQGRNVPVSASAEKSVSLRIDSMVYETWAGGFSRGAYMSLTVVTSDGLSKQFRVQDASAFDVARAIGGLSARAVEAILNDDQLVAFISR